MITEEKIINYKEIKEKKKLKNNKKVKFTITQILAYFIIYSILGYVIETLFGLVTKGVVESRQSFLYGPFCAIYGVGAVIMIIGLQYFKKNNYTLFFGGFLIGSIVEYFISLIGEVIFNIKWWDYSDMAFNINGRVCIAFSLIWGVLAIYLISHLNPIIDKLLNNFSPKILKIIVYSLTIIMFIDFLITGFALKIFFTRLVDNYNLELAGLDSIILEGRKAYENEQIKRISDTFFSDKKMLKTFPNIKLTRKGWKYYFSF